jgi:hypothetical protein
LPVLKLLLVLKLLAGGELMFLGKLKRPRMRREEADAIIERARTEEPLDLEKGDLKAIILAAFIVFVPFVLLIAGSWAFLWWFVFRVLGG